jgi:HlyD family secretion protein
MKRKILIPIILIIIIAVALIIYFSHHNKNGISGSGMIEVEEVAISSKVAGQIAELRIDEGSKVIAGDTLIVLDHKELAAPEKMAIAGLTVANQTLIGIRAQKQNLETNLERSRKLYATKNISDADWENVQTQYEVLKTNEEKAIAGVKSAQSQLELAQTQLANAHILSPIDGVVLAKNFDKGELIFPGAQLLTIGDLKRAWLKIYVSEKEMGRLHLGSKAAVYVDAYPKKKFDGTITWISSEAEFTPKNIQVKEERAQFVFAVKISIPNPDMLLIPGMPADAKILENHDYE